MKWRKGNRRRDCKEGKSRKGNYMKGKKCENI
jgi:hypothetical protein